MKKLSLFFIAFFIVFSINAQDANPVKKPADRPEKISVKALGLDRTISTGMQKTSQTPHEGTTMPCRVTRDPIPDGYCRITLSAGDVWGDGTGYQMLLDADATAYGTIIPETGPLARADVPASTYAEFEYKIPTNADGSLTTSNIVVNNSISIDIPAGTYDYCITNPTEGQAMWIAGGTLSRANDYTFQEGIIYNFSVVASGTNDLTVLEIDLNMDYDIEVVAITQPVTGVGHTAAEAVKATLKNNGKNDISNFELTLKVNGATIATETYTDTIDAKDQVEYTFAETIDMLASGEYTIAVIANLTGDEMGLNDSVSVTVTHVICDTVRTFPYSCGFEPTEAATYCWEFVDANGDGDGEYGEFVFAQADDGTMAAIFHSGDTTVAASNDWAISPEFDIPENHHASFQYATGVYFILSIPETFSVWALEDGATIENATNIVPSQTVGTGSLQLLEFDLSQFGNKTIRIGIKVETPPGDGVYFAFDNFKIQPTTPSIELVAEGAIDFQKAKVGNSVNRTASFKTLAVNDPITIVATGDYKVSLDGNTFTDTITMPAVTDFISEQNFRIQFIPTSVGTKTGTVTMTTNAISQPVTINLTGEGVECSVITSIPYTSDFSTEYPCWTVKDENNDGRTFVHSNGIFGYVYSETSRANDWLISPEIELNSSELTVRVEHACRSDQYPEKFSVWTVASDLTPITQISNIITVTNASAYQLTEAFSLGGSSGDKIRIGIKAESDPDSWTLFIKKVIVQQGVGLKDISIDNSVNIYPNPASSVLNITATSSINQVEVFNMAGQLIHKIQGNDTQLEINTSDFAQGFYFVKISSEEGVVTKKVSIVK
ncbi:DUF2436 domain-containing protein [Bacteroidales bacterium OttesenSCG-928-B11]|nr:DUF2436 domain-containing protein [Bacteroidales bacterium OttesenSCG-928-E04]MDL2309336.1 DUF2436 domain-containing protein [Bacteroidales bacterium OttesenSCG-928-C03]MDL2313093.1 DUF2436 domain-containing protein [Bacteroidales bacterium OttesenSCG-928-B11]MDL2326830.1 DUF2436 domain-containing protein [Bacteroidales bacterium OttesenSCG-928-A14]